MYRAGRPCSLGGGLDWCGRPLCSLADLRPGFSGGLWFAPTSSMAVGFSIILTAVNYN